MYRITWSTAQISGIGRSGRAKSQHAIQMPLFWLAVETLGRHAMTGLFLSFLTQHMGIETTPLHLYRSNPYKLMDLYPPKLPCSPSKHTQQAVKTHYYAELQPICKYATNVYTAMVWLYMYYVFTTSNIQYTAILYRLDL